jgi:hypothetical protein
MNAADLWFEQSIYVIQSEFDNIRDVHMQTSRQRLELESLRAELDRLIDAYQRK